MTMTLNGNFHGGLLFSSACVGFMWVLGRQVGLCGPVIGAFVTVFIRFFIN